MTRQLGQYRLKKKLGAGGMGEVHEAEHQLLKRPCAIKLIHPSKVADATALARFEREVQATARLTHWNTIEIFDYGHADDGTFSGSPFCMCPEQMKAYDKLDARSDIYSLGAVAYYGGAILSRPAAFCDQHAKPV